MYQCKGCGADLKFDIASQMLKCDQCDSTYDPYQLSQTNEAVEGTDAFDATTFTCPQCGGEIMSLDNTAAGFCSFCGTHTTLTSRMVKLAKPKYIIPFSVSKEECKKAYLKTARRAIYAPGELKKKEHIDSFRGIYMPYWLYDVEHTGHSRFEGVTVHTKGDYEITRHFLLEADVDNEYDGIAYDSSSSFADNISERIVPYDETQMKPFTPAFLSGFYGDGADVEADVYNKDAEAFANEATANQLKKDPAFMPYTITDTNSQITGGLNRKIKPAEAAVFPVWFMSYRNGSRVAYAAVNGQTGKAVADLPASGMKFAIGSLICAIPIFLILTFLVTMMPSTLLLATGIVALITMMVFAAAQTALDKRENGADDKGAVHDDSKPKVKSKKLSIPALVSVIIAAAVYFMNPINDLYFYGAAIAAAICEFVALFILVKHYNQLATRPLPQFAYKGGDNRA